MDRFSRVPFLAFLAAFVPVYYLTAHRYRWPLLTAASLFFYATFNVSYLALLLVVSAIAYGAGRLIDRPAGSRLMLGGAIGAIVVKP